MKLSHALEGFWLDKRLGLSQTTVANYERILARLIDYLGDAEIDQIKPIDIRRYLDDLHTNQGLSRRSVHTHWTALSSFWSWAEKELNTEHIMRARIPAPQYRKRVIEPLSQDEVQRLVAAAEYTKPWQTRSGRKTQSKRPTAARDKAIILVLVDTGIRASELCDVTIADYNDKLGRLLIRHGKGDKERYVVMGNRARKALWRYLIGRKDIRDADPLFITKTGRPMDRNNLRHTLNRIAAQAEVANVHPHRFRHTFAIQFLRNGGNMLLLKELLGHEKIDMVMTYVALAETDINDGARYSPADNWRL